MARRGGATGFCGGYGGHRARGMGAPNRSAPSPQGTAAPRRFARASGSSRIGNSTRCDAVTAVREGDLLWTPGEARRNRSQVLRFMQWLEEHRGLRLDNYDALWRWSITDLEGFWHSIWDYFGVAASVPFDRVLGRRSMPGAEWFPGARLNYAGHILARERPEATALISVREGEPPRRMSWAALGDQVRILATQMRRMGVRPGDRVAAVLPNAPHAAIAMLATTSIGAIWSCCGPDFGTKGVLERFKQLAPKIFFYVDAYQYGGKRYERSAELREVLAGLHTVEQAIYVPYDAGATDAACRPRAQLGRSHGPAARGARGFCLRAGRVRSSAVDPVLLRNDRAAEAHRSGTWRHSARTSEASALQLRGDARRAAVLLHRHVVDDMEFPVELARCECHPGAL